MLLCHSLAFLRCFSHTELRTRKLADLWTSRCLLYENSFEFSLKTTTFHTKKPRMGSLDLASVIISMTKLRANHIPFGTLFSFVKPFITESVGRFAGSRRFSCKGCQDGYWTQHMVESLNWRYEVLPVDTLSGVVYHGPSPLWCIASGNVWFDHRFVNQPRCYAQATVEKLLEEQTRLGIQYFDTEYYTRNPHCLRLTAPAFHKVSKTNGRMDVMLT